MLLESLREEIFKKTAALKFPQSKDVSRVFYVLISPGMSYLKDWFQQWFPMLDEDLEKIHPWITFDASAYTPTDMSEIVSQSWLQAFSIEANNNLIAKGYRMIDSANQIIMVGDLTESDFLEKLRTTYGFFTKNIPGELQAARMPLYRIGLFLIRSIEITDGKSKIRNTADFGEFTKWAQKNLDRVFLVDISNQFGFVLSETEDLHFLLGQLLYILTRKPLEFAVEGDPAGYGQWVRRDNATEGQCTGFSGISILTPVDQILEMALVKKGGEVLEESFFGTFPGDRIDLYYLSLLNKTGLNSYDTVANLLRSNKKYQLINPFAEGKESSNWDINHPENFIAYVDAIDAKLPGYADKNKEIMAEVGKGSLEDFRYILLDYIDAAISSEKGGVRIVEKFLKDLREHVDNMIPKEPSTKPVYPDPVSILRELERRTKTGPRKESVAIRTLLFFGVTFLGTYGIWGFFDFPFLFALIGTSLIAAGSGLIYWYAWKNQMERLVIEIQKILHDKWDILMKKQADEVIQDVLPKYLSIIDEIISRIDNTSRRLNELIDGFKNKHKVPDPMGSAFWMYALKGSDEHRKYSDMIDADVSAVATDYLLNEKPLKLWTRVSLVETTEPNPWEWELLEKAALRLIPYSGKILDLSVCKILRDHPEKANNFVELFRRSATPFLTLKPGQPHGDVTCTFEIPAEGCEDIYVRLENSIIGDIPNIVDTDSLTIYRVSLFSFMEGVNMNSLNRGA